MELSEFLVKMGLSMPTKGSDTWIVRSDNFGRPVLISADQVKSIVFALKANYLPATTALY